MQVERDFVFFSKKEELSMMSSWHIEGRVLTIRGWSGFWVRAGLEAPEWASLFLCDEGCCTASGVRE